MSKSKALTPESPTLLYGMVEVPAGNFLMGGDDADAGPYEKPVHEVWVPAFAIDDAPVTNRSFREFVLATGYVTTAEHLAPVTCREELKIWLDFSAGPEDRTQHPVVCVSWEDALAYCQWRTATTGVEVRLPSEAEWERAARGSQQLKLYPWGNDNPLGRACWNRWSESIGTEPVRSFAANNFGIYDMAGNVWEWCDDWYVDDQYAKYADGAVALNPQGPVAGTFKVRRGGAWNIGEPFRMRCANRGAMPPNQFWPNMGFRCVASLPQGK